jgi:hypothetical protein
MSITGIVTNGVVVLPAGVALPEGAMVRVEPVQLTPEDDPLVAALQQVAKPRPDWPEDYVVNHGHYVSGEPRRS